MKKHAFLLGIVLSLLIALPAFAAPVLMTFEGLGDQEYILNYYNGGPGPNYGVTFGADFLSIISYAAGGTGNFTTAPTMKTVMYFLSGPDDVMNVAAGFDTGFSFYYSAYVDGSVSVYDGLDGSGNLLASLALPANTTSDAYNIWSPTGVAFAGTAMSVIFSGSADFIGFDNVTLNSATPSNVPIPPTIWFMGSGLFGLVGWRRVSKG